MARLETKGLYDPQFEHDACGIGFVANLKNKKSHEIVEDALRMLPRMEHRGGCGCEANTGDGAGILIQKPHAFFAEECAKLGFELPEYEEYGVAQTFFPSDDKLRDQCFAIVNETLQKLGLTTLGERDVVVSPHTADIGPSSKAVMPKIIQLFIARPEGLELDAFERKLYIFRNYATHKIHTEIAGTEDDF